MNNPDDLPHRTTLGGREHCRARPVHTEGHLPLPSPLPALEHDVVHLPRSSEEFLPLGLFPQGWGNDRNLQEICQLSESEESLGTKKEPGRVVKSYLFCPFFIFYTPRTFFLCFVLECGHIPSSLLREPSRRRPLSKPLVLEAELKRESGAALSLALLLGLGLFCCNASFIEGKQVTRVFFIFIFSKSGNG